MLKKAKSINCKARQEFSQRTQRPVLHIFNFAFFAPILPSEVSTKEGFEHSAVRNYFFNTLSGERPAETLSNLKSSSQEIQILARAIQAACKLIVRVRYKISRSLRVHFKEFILYGVMLATCKTIAT